MVHCKLLKKIKNKRKLSKDEPTSATSNESHDPVEIKKPRVESVVKKSSKSSLVKDINQLLQSDGAPQSSKLLALQFGDFLKLPENCKEVSKFNNNSFKLIKQSLDKISDYEDLQFEECKEMKNKKAQSKRKAVLNSIKNHSRLLKTRAEIKQFNLIKPKGIHIIDNFNLDGILNCYVVIPGSCFNDKDFKDYKFFTKQFYYLVYIMHELQILEIGCEFKIESHQNNIYSQVLVASFSRNDITTKLRLLFIPEQSTFRAKRFLPEMNNLKHNVCTDVAFEKFRVEICKDWPTPLYNTSFLKFINFENYHSFIQTKIGDAEKSKQALRMLAVWLTNRALNDSFSGFTNEILTWLIAYMTHNKLITVEMELSRLVQSVWTFLRDTDWTKLGISFQKTSSSDDLKKFHDNFDVVFIADDGLFNITGFLNKDIYKRVRTEAEIALKIFAKSSDAFEHLFINKIPDCVQYDCMIQFTDLEKFYDKVDVNAYNWRFYGFRRLLAVEHILANLRIALSNRAVCIVPLESYKNDAQIGFGINFNHEYAFKITEICKSTIDTEVAKFKSFWGDLCKLTRFPDSSFYEAVKFNVNTVSQTSRQKVIHTVVQFVANKLKLSCNVAFDQIDSRLDLLNEETSRTVCASADKLFRLITDLPVKNTIKMVQGVSSVFCRAEPFPPKPKYSTTTYTMEENNQTLFATETVPNEIPSSVDVFNCVIHYNLVDAIEDSLDAYRIFLIEMYRMLAQILRSKFDITCRATCDFIDVSYGGHVFRMRAFNQRELLLLKRNLNAQGVLTFRSNALSIRQQTVLEVEPTIIGALNGLGKMYPTYGTTAAFAKCWIRSQLLHDRHISDMTINLLCAKEFLDSASTTSAACPQAAFMKFLYFLSTFDFDNSIAIVNFNNEIDDSKLKDLENDFTSNRTKYGPIHLVTPYNCGIPSIYDQGLDRVIYRRLITLATSSLNYLCSCINTFRLNDIQLIFEPTIKGYDVIITLNKVASDKICDTRQQFKKVGHKPKLMQIVDFNPVERYVNELEQNYGKLALFFYNKYGGEIVCIVWKPLDRSSNLKISNVPGCYVNDSGVLTVNKNAIIEDFRNLGRGLIKEIDVLEKS